jgi:hypothetical protein
MRPKFRVWSKKRNGWLTPEDSSLHCSSNWMMDIFSGEIIDFTQVDEEYHPDPEPKIFFEKGNIVNESPFVVQQWTGTKDKNGADIYQGDILEISWPGMLKYNDVVIWGKTNLNWYPNRPLTASITHETVSVKVVGNIFENSDLLNTKLQ